MKGNRLKELKKVFIMLKMMKSHRMKIIKILLNKILYEIDI